MNITARGISSISIGGRGMTLNIGKRGTKATVGVPGSGLFYSKNLSDIGESNENETGLMTDQPEVVERKVSPLLLAGIVLMPYVF